MVWYHVRRDRWTISLGISYVMRIYKFREFHWGGDGRTNRSDSRDRGWIENDGNAVCIADCRFHAVETFPLKSELAYRGGVFLLYRAIGMWNARCNEIYIATPRYRRVIRVSLLSQSQRFGCINLLWKRGSENSVFCKQNDSVTNVTEWSAKLV